MPYRNIFITSQSGMKLKNNQLPVSNGDNDFSFPVEDIKKQYESMQILLGECLQCDTPVSYEQLTIL